MFGSDLSPDAQAAIAGNAARFGSDARRVLLHPLPLYNNSVGAHDLTPGRKTVEDVVRGAKALLIGGSVHDASGLKDKEFVVVQEMFLTETTDFADIVFPAASFAEMDGTYTNNAGNVQRVRKAIEPLFQSKTDWMITALIAREMGFDITHDFSASGVFRSIADSVPAYAGLRYPALKDESQPVQAKYEIAKTPDISKSVNLLQKRLETLSDAGEKNMEYEPVLYAELATDAALLHDIYVEPDARHLNTGSSLIKAVEAEAKRLGADKVLLSVALRNMGGQKLFEQYGFRTTMLEMMLEIDKNNG